MPHLPGRVVRVLTAEAKRILDFEQRRYRLAGAKEQAIRAELDLSAVRYYQLLNALLDDPAAVEYAPTLVNRLRRLRAARVRQRSAA